MKEFVELVRMVYAIYSNSAPTARKKLPRYYHGTFLTWIAYCHKRCLHLGLGYSAAATAGVGKIEGGTNAYDHGLSFKSLSRATPCISSLKKRFLSPIVENKYQPRCVFVVLPYIGEEYFHWLIKIINQ